MQSEILFTKIKKLLMTLIVKESIDYIKHRCVDDRLMLFVESLLLLWLCANFSMLVYYNLYTYQIYFHSDSATKCMLAEEIYRTGQFFPKEWVYVNNDLFVIFGHLFIVPLLPWFSNGYNLHAISGIVSAAIICASFFWLARALKMRTVSILIGLIFFSSGISASFSENLYGQVSYGVTVYILFSLLASIISIGNTVERLSFKSASFQSVILCLITFLLFLSNPARTIAIYFAPLCAGLMFVWILADSEMIQLPNFTIVFRFGLPLLVLMSAAFGVLYHHHIISHQSMLASGGHGLFVDFNRIVSQFNTAVQSLLYLSDSLPEPNVNTMSFHGIDVFSRFVFLNFSLLSPLIVFMASFGNRYFPFRATWRTIFISTFTLFLFLVTAYLFVFTSVTVNIMSCRYFVPSLTLCFVCVLLFIDSIRRPAVFITLTLIISPVMLSGYANYVEPFQNAEKIVLASDKRFLTEYLNNEGLVYGYATFWNSNVISVLSGGAVKVRAIRLDSGLPQPYLHLSSLAWYRPEAHAGESFLLLTDAELKELNMNALYAQTGTPVKVLKFEGHNILVFDSNISSKLFTRSGDQMMQPLPISGFKAKIDPQVSQFTIKLGETTTVPVKVSNIGDSRWSSVCKDGGCSVLSVALAYHVLDSDGNVVSEGKRTALPGNVMPNQTVLLNANLEAQTKAGHYTYAFDMVQEGVSWFEGKGSAVSKIIVTVN
jgi:hypothetical protein